MHTVWLWGDRLGLLGPGASKLWPKAEALDVGGSMAVTLRLFVGNSPAGSDCPQAGDVGAAVIRLQEDSLALVGVGQAGDGMSLAQGPDGHVWAWLLQQQQPKQQQEHQQQQQLQRPKAATSRQEGVCGDALPGTVCVYRGQDMDGA